MTIVPQATMAVDRLRVLASRDQKGIDRASRIEHAIIVIGSQRQGNCVSCKKRTRFQIGRDSGVDMNSVIDSNTVNATASVVSASVLLLLRICRAARVTRIIAGQNIARLDSSRMFIHQTLTESGESLDSTKL